MLSLLSTKHAFRSLGWSPYLWLFCRSAAPFSCPFAGKDHSRVSDTVGPVTFLRSLPWHWLLQQLKCQKYKGTAESTAWSSSLCTAQHLTPYPLQEEEEQRGQERGRSRGKDRKRGEKEKREKKVSIWQDYLAVFWSQSPSCQQHTQCASEKAEMYM